MSRVGPRFLQWLGNRWDGAVFRRLDFCWGFEVIPRAFESSSVDQFSFWGRAIGSPQGCETDAMRMWNKPLLLLFAFLVAGSCSEDFELASAAQESITTVAPATIAPTESKPASPVDTEALSAIREGLVEILMEREGLERAIAEERAADLWEQGVAPEVIELMFTVYSEWMSNYPFHPVLGRQWTEDQATCAILTMMQVEGIARSQELMVRAREGGMPGKDAMALVQPVAFCVDLVSLMRADMTALGVRQDLDCLLAGVVEEDVASWYGALFTHGPEGFNAAMSQDLDLTCPGDP